MIYNRYNDILDAHVSLRTYTCIYIYMYAYSYVSFIIIDVIYYDYYYMHIVSV